MDHGRVIYFCFAIKDDEGVSTIETNEGYVNHEIPDFVAYYFILYSDYIHTYIYII